MDTSRRDFALSMLAGSFAARAAAPRGMSTVAAFLLSGAVRMPAFPATSASENERDTFWQGEGYTLIHTATPTGNEASYVDFIDGPWRNGGAYMDGTDASYASSIGTVSIVNTPTGYPALRGRTNSGVDGTLFNVKAAQLGVSQTTYDHAVFSVRMRCSGATFDTGSGLYTGIGHHVGSTPGHTSTPGGSSAESNAWSLRVPYKPDRDSLFLYVYPFGTTTADSLGSGASEEQITAALDQDHLVEVEVISNTAGSSDGRLRLYLNGVLRYTKDGYAIRDQNDCCPKGFGIFIKQNGTTTATTDLYLWDWRLYAKGSGTPPTTDRP